VAAWANKVAVKWVAVVCAARAAARWVAACADLVAAVVKWLAASKVALPAVAKWVVRWAANKAVLPVVAKVASNRAGLRVVASSKAALRVAHLRSNNTIIRKKPLQPERLFLYQCRVEA
jgi:hypothetical protein